MIPITFTLNLSFKNKLIPLLIFRFRAPVIVLRALRFTEGLIS